MKQDQEKDGVGETRKGKTDNTERRTVKGKPDQQEVKTGRLRDPGLEKKIFDLRRTLSVPAGALRRGQQGDTPKRLGEGFVEPTTQTTHHPDIAPARHWPLRLRSTRPSYVTRQACCPPLTIS